MYSYDSSGNLIEVSDNHGDTTAYFYDAMHRLVSETVTPPSGGLTTTITYDVSGNVISVSDSGGPVTTYMYDALNRVTQQTEMMGIISLTPHTAKGRIGPVAKAKAKAAGAPAGSRNTDYARHSAEVSQRVGKSASLLRQKALGRGPIHARVRSRVDFEQRTPRVNIKGDGSLALEGIDEEIARTNGYALYVRPGWAGFLPWHPDGIGPAPKSSLPSIPPALTNENL